MWKIICAGSAGRQLKLRNTSSSIVLPCAEEEARIWKLSRRREDRKCGEAVETAKHVIFDCHALCRRRSSYLEVVQKEGRQWARAHQDWLLPQWRNVLFSDEPRFGLMRVMTIGKGFGGREENKID
nr:unnamed protein product [Callosobruchus chinensis]